MKTTDFAVHLSRYFTRYLPNENGSSPQTIDTYRNAFVLYLEYMESICGIKPEKISVMDYTRESILGFLKWLEECRKNSPATRNYRLAAMKGFVHYLKYELPDYMEEYQRILGIPLKKTEQKTAGLFRVAIEGAIKLAGGKNLQEASEFALNFGTAFQIRDDLLNITGPTQLKPSQNDLLCGIYNAPVIFSGSTDNLAEGIEKTKDLLNNYVIKMLILTDKLTDSKYKTALRELLELLNDA